MLRRRGPAVADHGETRAGLGKFISVRPQLGRLLAARRSPIVAQKDQDRRPVAPEISKPNRPPLEIVHFAVGEAGIHRRM